MISILGTLWDKAGLNSIAAIDADPRFVSHIANYPGEMDVSDKPADCGFPLGEVQAGRTAAICPHCTELNADQPWIQRLMSA